MNRFSVLLYTHRPGAYEKSYYSSLMLVAGEACENCSVMEGETLNLQAISMYCADGLFPVISHSRLEEADCSYRYHAHRITALSPFSSAQNDIGVTDISRYSYDAAALRSTKDEQR